MVIGLIYHKLAMKGRHTPAQPCQASGEGRLAVPAWPVRQKTRFRAADKQTDITGGGRIAVLTPLRLLDNPARFSGTAAA